MASRSFKPKATNNTEGAIPIEEVGATITPDEVSSEVNPVEETPVAEVISVEETEKVETSPETTVTFEDTKSTPIKKNVKVCLRANHSCSIGGVTYHFEKGKQYNVPESVKSILLQADLLKPL